MAQRSFKVLLADDVKLELEIERTFFRRSGFTVLAAADGPGALALATAERPDLVILDEVMPGLSGTDVCRVLKSRTETSGIPVIITSGSAAPDLPDLCRAAGADAFVPKGEGREALLRTAARLLNVSDRRAAKITTFFAVQEIVGGKETLGKTVDISEVGISLETARRYDPGLTFLLRFLIPGERQEQRATARLVRVEEQASGTHRLRLEFIEMSKTDRTRLNQYLDRNVAVS